MQEVVLGSHLALLNVYMALEADKDPLPKKNGKPLSDSEVSEYNRGLQRVREHVREMVSSPAAYVRATGYHEAFGLEPEPVKSAEELRREDIERARRIPEEAREFFTKNSVLARAARSGKGFAPVS